MTEGITIAPFVSQEGRFLDKVRKAVQEHGHSFSIDALDGSTSTEGSSYEIEVGIWLTLQKIGFVEYLTARKIPEEGEEVLLLEVERQADSYIVWSHESAKWERPFRRKKKAEKPAQTENPA